MFDILEKIKKEEINIAKLAKDTGIPSGRIYKWKDRGSKITLEDALKLGEWVGSQSDNSTDTLNLEKQDLPEARSNEQIYAAIQEVAEAVRKIERKIQEVYPEERDNLLAVKKAIQNKDSVGGTGKAGKQK